MIKRSEGLPETRITGSERGARLKFSAFIAKLIIPEYEMIKKKKGKKGGKNLFSRPTREPVIPSLQRWHGPQKQWRSLEILYVSATSPVKGGRKELAELKGTMFNPTLQPPVESFDEV